MIETHDDEPTPEAPDVWEDPGKKIEEGDYGSWSDPGKPEQKGLDESPEKR